MDIDNLVVKAISMYKTHSFERSEQDFQNGIYTLAFLIKKENEKKISPEQKEAEIKDILKRTEDQLPKNKKT